MTAPAGGVSAMMAGMFLTKHGFPPGYRFVPTGLELISLLSDKIDGVKLRPQHDSIFHDLPILDYHPKELYDGYRQDKEHRYIYFFSQRAFQKQGTGGAIAGGRKEKDQKSPRPVRVARGGTWKASGCGKLLYWPRNKGGFVAGRVVTMVFYDHGGNKSNWGMHEFTVPVDKKLRQSSLPTKASYKYIRFRDLALYRLYILRNGDMEIENDAGSSSLQMLANANDHFPALSTVVAPPCLPVQPSWGIFAAGPSTSSQTPPQQQHPGAEHALFYHQQPAFAAAAAAQQQAHTMPMHGADCSKPVEEAAAPKLEDVVLTGEDERTGMADADEYLRPGMPDWDLSFGTFDDHSFQFLMEEILALGDRAALGESPAMEGGSNSGGGGSCSQPAGGAQQEPPAAQGCS